jgi:3-phenylpropionate/trans-cinnamate dioxygenase ferredoxin reductase subunit
MRIVIVGAGLAGGNVVGALRDEGFDGEVVLLGDEPGVPFGRPPLSKTYLRDEEDLSGWLPKPADWYAKNDVDLRPEALVESVDPTGRVVLSTGDEVGFDRLCVATGCRPRIPELPGIDLDGVLPLRTKAHCDEIKERASQRGAKAVVVGMSFIGSEVAASLRQLGVEVAAILPGSGPLGAVLGDDVARRMAEIHRSEGVELLAGEKVGSFRGKSKVEQVVTESGKAIDCTFAVIGLGVEPNTGFLDGSGVATDNGVLVDVTCRSSVDTVYATGDVANHDHPLFGRIRVEHYNNAEKQSRYVARAMLGSVEPFDYVHSFWSDQYDHKLEYIGYAKEWDDFVVRGDVESGFLGFYLKDGVVLAAMGLDRGGDPEAEPTSELAACVSLIRKREPIDPRSLADESADLAAVARA